MILISAAVYLLMFFGSAPIVGIFNSEGNALLQQIAETGLKIYFTGCVFAGLNIVHSVFFTSTERPLPAHVISLLRGFILIIPMAFLLSSLAELYGVWAAFPVTELLVCAVGVVLLSRYR